jgi:hypothetical protein
MENILMEKDLKLRELEMSSTKSATLVSHLEPELEKMEEKYTREKDRLGKVFAIAEELDNDLKLAVTEMKARDGWYVAHMALFEDLNKAIQERYEMIEQAVESERAAQQKADAFVERMDSMVEARAAEMTIEEAEGAIAEEASSTSSEDQIVVPVGVVEVAISPGPDGEFGTDDDEVEVRARGGSDDAPASEEEAEPEPESEPETEEAPAEESATWDDGEDPWDGA